MANTSNQALREYLVNVPAGVVPFAQLLCWLECMQAIVRDESGVAKQNPAVLS